MFVVVLLHGIIPGALFEIRGDGIHLNLQNGRVSKKNGWGIELNNVNLRIYNRSLINNTLCVSFDSLSWRVLGTVKWLHN